MEVEGSWRVHKIPPLDPTQSVSNRIHAVGPISSSACRVTKFLED
jgi:hypothetical protein